MEVRVLRYFLAVVDEASITRAAAVVRVAQPSLSRQIRASRRPSGRELFDRSDGRLRLTPAGRQLVPLARDIVARTDAAEAAMLDLEASRGTGLSVVAPQITIVDVIAPYLATLGPRGAQGDRPRCPVARGVPHRPLRRRGPRGLRGAAPGRAGVAAGRAVLDPRAGAARPSLGAPVPVPLKELVTEPLVLVTPAQGTRRVFDQAVAEAALKYHAVAEAELSAVAQTLAAGGAGVAIVSDDVRYGLRALEIEAGDEVLAIPIVAAWEASHFAAPMIQAWAGRLADYTRARYGSGDGPAAPAGPPVRGRAAPPRLELRS